MFRYSEPLCTLGWYTPAEDDTAAIVAASAGLLQPGHCQVTESDPILRVPMRMPTVPRLRGVVTEMKW